MRTACRDLRGWVCSHAGQSLAARGSDESLSVSSLLSETMATFLVRVCLVICRVGCTTCMHMTLLSKGCSIKVSSRDMKTGTRSGIFCGGKRLLSTCWCSIFQKIWFGNTNTWTRLPTSNYCGNP